MVDLTISLRPASIRISLHSIRIKCYCTLHPEQALILGYNP